MSDTGKDLSRRAARTGKEPAVEQFHDRYIENGTHLFLSLLAVVMLVAAVIAGFDVVIRDLPLLWRQGNQYDALHQVIQNILLVAIVAELGLLLLFHQCGNRRSLFRPGAENGHARYFRG